MKTVFLFPGQGSQYAGMLKELDDSSSFAVDLYKQVEEVLGVSAVSLDTEQKLVSTLYVQLCLFIAGVLAAKKLLESDIKPDYVAGHSIGAFGAAVICGVITFKEGLSLVYNRACLMEQAYPEGYGMAAVVGFTAHRLQQFLEIHNKDHTKVYLANSNTADQQVIAGKVESIEALFPILQKAGARKIQFLKMPVPSHCELLQGVSDVLKDKLDAVETREPLMGYLSNHTGRLLKTGKAVKEDLYRSVSMMVRWYEGTTLLYELGTRLFLEVAPSGVLARMAETAFTEASVMALKSDNIQIAQWLYHTHKSEQ